MQMMKISVSVNDLDTQGGMFLSQIPVIKLRFMRNCLVSGLSSYQSNVVPRVMPKKREGEKELTSFLSGLSSPKSLASALPSDVIAFLV